jgi:hypothetical protein
VPGFIENSFTDRDDADHGFDRTCGRIMTAAPLERSQSFNWLQIVDLGESGGGLSSQTRGNFRWSAMTLLAAVRVIVRSRKLAKTDLSENRMDRHTRGECHKEYEPTGKLCRSATREREMAENAQSAQHQARSSVAPWCEKQKQDDCAI